MSIDLQSCALDKPVNSFVEYRERWHAVRGQVSKGRWVDLLENSSLVFNEDGLGTEREAQFADRDRTDSRTSSLSVKTAYVVTNWDQTYTMKIRDGSADGFGVSVGDLDWDFVCNRVAVSDREGGVA